MSPFGIHYSYKPQCSRTNLNGTDPDRPTTGLLWTPAERDVSETANGRVRRDPRLAPPGASVLVLTIDAWRADLAEHHLDHVMPNLSRRAKTGAYFKRAYAASTRTHESIYSLMTGQWPHRLTFTPAGVDKNDRFREIDDSYSIKQIQLLPLHDTSATLAQTLSQAGYKTAAIIPYVFFLRDAGITRGFEHIDDRAYLEANKKARGVTSPILTDQTIQWITRQ